MNAKIERAKIIVLGILLAALIVGIAYWVTSSWYREIIILVLALGAGTVLRPIYSKQMKEIDESEKKGKR